MIIKIDTREKELIKKCENTLNIVSNFKDIKILVESLPLGDIIINNETDDCIIIERKTLSDLASSIKDGRYEEQSYRLNGIEHHNHNIIYMIEGNMQQFNSFKERIDKQTLYSAMTSINYFKGFSVMRSNAIDETAYIICNMAYKIGKSKDRLGFYNNKINKINNINNIINNNTNNLDTTDNTTDNINNTDNKDNQLQEQKSEKDYCSVIKKVKKENITPKNIGEIMLCQIPGISSTTALAILLKFKTLQNLIKCIQEDNTCLNNTSTIDSNNKSRKINKTAIANIIKFLIVKDEDEDNGEDTESVSENVINTNS
jgi:ERCC4-type nuclease